MQLGALWQLFWVQTLALQHISVWLRLPAHDSALQAPFCPGFTLPALGTRCHGAGLRPESRVWAAAVQRSPEPRNGLWDSVELRELVVVLRNSRVMLLPVC